MTATPMSLRLALAALLSVTVTAAARAQPATGDWPNRPVTVIVPFPAGSATDVIARIVTKELTVRLKAPVVIENRPGGDTTIGTRALARSQPDGYTIGFAGLTATSIAPSTHRVLGYDSQKDLAPVALVGRIPYVLIIYPGLAAKTLPEFVALAKAKPGSLNYASAGEVSLANLGMLILAGKTGITLTHVPYRSTTQSIVDIVSGVIHAQIASVPPTLELERTGKVRALAVTTEKRIATMPDTPTVAEAGVPGYDLSFWTAIFAPAGTPPAIVERLNREINGILLNAEVRKALAEQGVDADPTTPNALGAMVRKETAKFHAVVEQAGIKPQ
jgi:tripartite-type tricarboxylate transporter receptor subunit TctC